MPRKTRKQKIKIRERASKLDLVKREFTFSLKNIQNKKSSLESSKKADLSMLSEGVSIELKDILKSLLVAGGLIIMELVIYFSWFK